MAADEAPGSVVDDAQSWLAAACARPAGLSPQQLIGAIVAADRLESLLHAAQSSLLAEFSRPGRSGDLTELITVLTEEFGEATNRDGTINMARLELLIEQQAAKLAAAELGMALRISPLAAAGRMNRAVELVEELPATHEALLRGRIDKGRARIVAEQTAVLDGDVRQLVEQDVLAAAQSLPPRKFAAVVGRAVIIADPEAAEKRAKKARGERRVTRRWLPDGVGLISAFLPAEGALSVYTLLDLIAAANKGLDDRCVDERRADAFTDIADRLLAGQTITIADILDLTACADGDGSDHSGAGNASADVDTDADAAPADATGESEATTDQPADDTGAVDEDIDGGRGAAADAAGASDADTEAAANANGGSDGAVDAAADVDTDADADRGSESQIDADADRGSEAQIDADADRGSEAQINTADADRASGTLADAADSEIDADAETVESRVNLAGRDRGVPADVDADTEVAALTPALASVPAAPTDPARRGKASVPTRQGRPVHLNLTMSLSTLAALDDLPVHLADHGAMTAEWGRAISRAAASVTLLILDPETGETVGVSDRTYRINQSVRDKVTALNETCRWLGCGQPSWRCDLDHVQPFDHRNPAAGGLTNERNLDPACRGHHLLKTHGGWSYHRNPDRSTTFTSPIGNSYASPPDALTLPGEWLHTVPDAPRTTLGPVDTHTAEQARRAQVRHRPGPPPQQYDDEALMTIGDQVRAYLQREKRRLAQLAKPATHPADTTENAATTDLPAATTDLPAATTELPSATTDLPGDDTPPF